MKKTCLTCGKEFEVPKSESKRRFCSKECWIAYRKSHQVKKTCLVCGKEFKVPKSESKRKFCSKKCSDLYHKRKVKRVCLNCGKEFEVWECTVKQGFGNFCSRKCAGSYRKRKVKKTCLNCGKEFEVWRYLVNQGFGNFCSRNCKDLYERKRVKKVCLVCGKEFEVFEARAKNGAKFCSRECYFKYLKGKEVHNQLSKNMIAKWKDSEYREKQVTRIMEGSNMKPNRLEKSFYDLLQNYFNNEWEYTGDGRVLIAGRVPDFIHKEEKWIIEVNGTYWHNLPGAREKDKRKKKAYENSGYKVLEIWESEVMTDSVAVVNKIVDCFYADKKDGISNLRTL